MDRGVDDEPPEVEVDERRAGVHDPRITGGASTGTIGGFIRIGARRRRGMMRFGAGHA